MDIFDIEFSTWPPRRKGGQHVPSFTYAVLAVHRSTGCAFLSQSERSQWANRQNAEAQLAELVKYRVHREKRMGL